MTKKIDPKAIRKSMERTSRQLPSGLIGDTRVKVNRPKKK